MKSRLIGLALLSAGLLFVSASSWASDKPPMKNGPTMTTKEAIALVARAKTSKDHMKLAQYFSQQADQFEADAREHDEMIVAYRKVMNHRGIKAPEAAGTIEHCEFLAKSGRETAKAFREMAEAHQEMVTAVGKN